MKGLAPSWIPTQRHSAGSAESAFRVESVLPFPPETTARTFLYPHALTFLRNAASCPGGAASTTVPTAGQFSIFLRAQ
ncbi:MAG: hypothetical protein A2636_00640 [Elusimicrobia bacterium RIFCSPHIGHO2_01_FULL_64_10]|nr:MAG: hypothetical protein A2636_00640 [Elusimicrobia bacterium RIFCSPHIGHO2_01_FULL_64_10]